MKKKNKCKHPIMIGVGDASALKYKCANCDVVLDKLPKTHKLAML